MKVTSFIWLFSLFAVFYTETVKSESQLVTAAVNYRLPNETYPEHYDIKLSTNVDKGEKSFQGEVIIDIKVVSTTNSIVLHARQIDISTVAIKNLLTGESEELAYEYEIEREFLKLSRKKPEQFAAATKWQLTITYSGVLRRHLNGFYMTDYTDDEDHTHYLAATRFETAYARYAFPCYDEPAKRANFTITITHSPTYNAISNMPVNKDLSSAGKTVFLTTPRISTSMVAFVVSDFEYSEKIENGLTHRIYSRPNARNERELALVYGTRLVEQVPKYYGVELMTSKMDHVAIPDFFLRGTESFGLVTYREDSLLYTNQTSNVFEETSIAKGVAHAISQQVCGDYFTLESWSNLWLKEGFAKLFSYKALDNINPEMGLWQQFHTKEYQKALYTDAGYSPRPLSFYVQKPNEVLSLYDTVSDYKAAPVLHMWNNALTDKVFQKGLKNFLIKNKYSAGSEEQLFSAIQKAVEEENLNIPAAVSEMMSTWTHQGGYPILTVTRNYEDGTFSVEQETYFDDKTFKDHKTWYVPINYAVASNTDFNDTKATHYLLNAPKTIIKDVKIPKSDWLLLNKQSTGLYRVNYDAENWNLIAEGLIERPFNIHLRNRAQLMDDAYRFTLSNRLDHGVLLKLLSYLKHEDQYAPWSTAEKILSTYIHYLEGHENFDDLKFFIAEQVGPIFNSLGVSDIPDEHHYNKYTRNLVIELACKIGIKKCLQDANNQLKVLVAKNTTMEPTLKKIIYCNGLRQSDDELFNLVYKQFLDAANPVTRYEFLSALGCTQNEKQIKKLIYKSFDDSDNLPLYERYSLLNRVYSRGEVGLLASIEFLNENWNSYASMGEGKSPLKPLDMDIRGMAKYVVNKNQEEKLLALVSKVKNSRYVKPSLESAVKNMIASNLQWPHHHSESVMSWISKYRALNIKNHNVLLL